MRRHEERQKLRILHAVEDSLRALEDEKREVVRWEVGSEFFSATLESNCGIKANSPLEVYIDPVLDVWRRMLSLGSSECFEYIPYKLVFVCLFLFILRRLASRLFNNVSVL